jgi:hypothetical protein
VITGPFQRFFKVVFTNEDVFANVFNTLVRLGGDMSKIFMMRWKVTIDTFNAKSVFVGAMCGKLPAPVCGLHLMARAAAKFRL